MKKLILLLMAFAMTAAFASGAYAADSAQLGLQVTFAEDQDRLRIEDLERNVTVLDTDCLRMYQQAVESENPDQIRQAIHDLTMERDEKVEGIKREAMAIAERRPDLRANAYAVVDHTQRLQDTIADYIRKLETLLEPVISIELEGPNPWALDGVKLGELRSNVTPIGPMHSIRNAGNVAVVVEIGYVPLEHIANGVYDVGEQFDDLNGNGVWDAEWFNGGTGLYEPAEPFVDGLVFPFVHPGFNQDVDTYVTMMKNNVVIPPDGMIGVGRISPDAAVGLELTFGAPTALSQPTTGVGASYFLRAYKLPVVIDEVPIE